MTQRSIAQRNIHCVVNTNIQTCQSNGASQFFEDFSNNYNSMYQFVIYPIDANRINISKNINESAHKIDTNADIKFGSALPIVCNLQYNDKNNKIEKPKSYYTKDKKMFVNYLWDFPNINIGKLHKKLRKYEPNSKHTSCIEIDALLKRATKDELKEVLRPSEYIQIQHYALDKLPPKIPNPYQFLIPKEN